MPSDALTPLRRAHANFERDREAARGAQQFLTLLLVPEDAPPPEYCVIVNHIPKTGGTTLRELIIDNHPGAELLRVVVPATGHKELRLWHRDFAKSLTDSERRRLAAVTGHIAGYLAKPLDRPARMITIVRDPVDRALSWFYYNKTNMARVDSEGYTIRDMFERGAKADHYNGQARILLGPEFDTAALVQSQGPPPDGDVWRSRLFGLLADRYIVGVQDTYQASLERFASQLGWSTTTVDRSKKVNPRRPRDAELDEETYNLIRDMNWLDVELYEHYRESYPEATDRPGYVVKRTSASSRTTIKELAAELERTRAATRREVRALRLRLEASERKVQERDAAAAGAIERMESAAQDESREVLARVKTVERKQAQLDERDLRLRVKALERKVRQLEAREQGANALEAAQTEEPAEDETAAAS